MRDRQVVLFAGGLAILALLFGLVGGMLLHRHLYSKANTSVAVPAGAEGEFELMAEVWRTIEREYVNQQEVDAQLMAYGATRGMVRTLGDAGHTRFLTPRMAELHQSQLEGEFEGIGAYVEMRDGRVVIVAPIDDTPAQRAGLEAGDVILEVNGEEVTDLPLDEVVSRVLGRAGTEVTLTILDPDTGETREVTVQRAKIDLDLVTWQRLPGTGVAYVRISAFSEGATEDLQGTLEEIQEAAIDGLVLDLRSNPGGLLDEAVGVTSHFVEEGNVLLRRDAKGETREEPVKARVDAMGLPMTALANGGTASAAEIVIGALQDHERATVVGTTTFGAGTVLSEFTMSDGSVLLLAVEEWLTPDGRVIWQEGLPPDVKVSLPAGQEPLPRMRLQEITEEELKSGGDEQLLRGLEVLGGSDEH
ncbi:MAG: S41 family peptidase [Anaerolineae bacterium]|nr:S41 family peptidase [Anaerolineae bacterium]